jgi:uncharacterized membrane protein YeaQ/YmgE (transglycosylase-associated protein family)
VEFTVNVGIGGWALIIVASLVFGVLLQFIGKVETGYEWLIDAVAFFIGAVVASEFITAWRTFEPVWDNVALVPALIGGLVVGIVVEVITRMLTGGSYTERPMSA